MTDEEIIEETGENNVGAEEISRTSAPSNQDTPQDDKKQSVSAERIPGLPEEYESVEDLINDANNIIQLQNEAYKKLQQRYKEAQKLIGKKFDKLSDADKELLKKQGISEPERPITEALAFQSKVYATNDKGEVAEGLYEAYAKHCEIISKAAAELGLSAQKAQKLNDFVEDVVLGQIQTSQRITKQIKEQDAIERAEFFGTNLKEADQRDQWVIKNVLAPGLGEEYKDVVDFFAATGLLGNKVLSYMCSVIFNSYNGNQGRQYQLNRGNYNPGNELNRNATMSPEFRAILGNPYHPEHQKALAELHRRTTGGLKKG